MGPLRLRRGQLQDLGQNQEQAKEYYDYNQLQYRLDLEHPLAMVPSAVYKLTNGDVEFASTIRANDGWDRVMDIAFYAFQPQIRPPGSVPVYKSFDGGLSLSGQGQGSPFMYALDPLYDPESNLTGTWNIHLKSFASIEAYLQVTLGKDVGKWNIATTGETMEVKDPSVRDGKLSFSLYQYGKHYVLSCMAAETQNGKITGTWIRLREDGTTSSEFEWEGVQVDRDQVWYPAQSPGLISIDQSGMPNQTSSICRVWPNPHDQLFLDPHIVPTK